MKQTVDGDTTTTPEIAVGYKHFPETGNYARYSYLGKDRKYMKGFSKLCVVASNFTPSCSFEPGANHHLLHSIYHQFHLHFGARGG